MSKEQELTEIVRAEDIFLGALGLSDDACLNKLIEREDKIFVAGNFKSDQEKFELEFDLEIGDLEIWALKVLKDKGRVVKE